jgi:hypothetical protein
MVSHGRACVVLILDRVCTIAVWRRLLAASDLVVGL